MFAKFTVRTLFVASSLENRLAVSFARVVRLARELAERVGLDFRRNSSHLPVGFHPFATVMGAGFSGAGPVFSTHRCRRWLDTNEHCT